MATKNNYLSSNGEFIVNDNNPQYNNLNLNQFSNGRKISKFAVIRGPDMNGNESRDNWKDYNFSNNDNGRKEGFWKHGSRRGNMYGQDSSVKGWKKKKDSKTKGATSSTLSLHIAAYENAIQAQNSAKTSREKAKHSKKALKAFTKVLFMNPFEIPRQANDRQLPVPEVVQFKARQKLLQQPQTSAGIGAAESFTEEQTQSDIDVTQLDISSRSGSDESGMKIAAIDSALQNSLVETTALSTSFNSGDDEMDMMIKKDFAINTPFEGRVGHDHDYTILSVPDGGGCGTILEIEEFLGDRFAVKVEPVKFKTVKKEIRIYRDLWASYAKDESVADQKRVNERISHFLQLVDSGVTRDQKYNYLIMPLMGENLHVFKDSVKTVNVYTIARIYQQCLLAVMDFHQIGYLHLDIKPKNILFARPGTPERQVVYLIDFGLSETIKNVKIGDVDFVGTEEYASLNAHDGYQQSRADDLLCLWMTILTLFKALPWSECSELDELIRLKRTFLDDSSARQTFYGNDVPSQMEAILQYILSLGFHDIPNYALLHQKLNEMIHKCYITGNLRGLAKFTFPVMFDPSKEYRGPHYGTFPRQKCFYVHAKNNKHLQLYINGYMGQKNTEPKSGDLEYFYAYSEEKGAKKYRIIVRNYKTAVPGEYPDVVLYEDLMISNSFKIAKSLPPAPPLGQINVELTLVDVDDPDYISDYDFKQIFKKCEFGGFEIINKKAFIERAQSFIDSDKEKYQMILDYDTESDSDSE